MQGQKDSGTVELNRLNDLSNYLSHLKTQHSGNPAADVARERLKNADAFGKITPEALTDAAGEMIWQVDQDDRYEELRAITDHGDAFEPDFELGTDAHAEWVREAKAKFE